MPVYLALQPIVHAAHRITTASGELLPHLFTLTFPSWKGGRFLSCIPTVADSFPLGNMVLYVARTFLTPLSKSMRDEMPDCTSAKVVIFHPISKVMDDVQDTEVIGEMCRR